MVENYFYWRKSQDQMATFFEWGKLKWMFVQLIRLLDKLYLLTFFCMNIPDSDYFCSNRNRKVTEISLKHPSWGFSRSGNKKMFLKSERKKRAKAIAAVATFTKVCLNVMKTHFQLHLTRLTSFTCIFRAIYICFQESGSEIETILSEWQT